MAQMTDVNERGGASMKSGAELKNAVLPTVNRRHEVLSGTVYQSTLRHMRMKIARCWSSKARRPCIIRVLSMIAKS